MSGSKKHKEKKANETPPSNTGEADIEGKTATNDAPRDHAEAGDSESKQPAQHQDGTAELEKELEACKDRHLRLQADFDNFRKRSIKESTELVKTATRDFIERLLPVLDHFELGLKAAEESESSKSVAEGFRLVYNQLQDELKAAGVTPFDSEGQPFDHNLHDCISRIPSAEYPEDVIATQIRRGYYINDKILRHAQVVVSSGHAQDLEADNRPDTGADADQNPDIAEPEPN